MTIEILNHRYSSQETFLTNIRALSHVGSLSIRLCPFVVALALGAPGGTAVGNEPVATAASVIRTGVADPTKDKPQSKLWYARDRWWAWLPVPGGSALYERTPSGWREVESLHSHLAGLPGQGDVWSDDDSARAVLVGDDRLAVVELRYDADRGTYIPGRLRQEFQLPGQVERADRVETATICCDAKGRWWVAFDRGRTISVFWTTDTAGLEWSGPFIVGAEVGSDDISAIFALRDRIGVLWSNQKSDAVYFREHFDAQPPHEWSKTIIVDQGGKTADDHIHGVLAADGTLFVATKNSVDKIDEPQQVLRVRRPDGRWENQSYAPLLKKLSPSRPIALLGGSPQVLYLLHTLYDRRTDGERRDYIALIKTDPHRLELSGQGTRFLSAARSINNVTGPRRMPPAGIPWIVLASDADGNVYEGHLPPP